MNSIINSAQSNPKQQHNVWLEEFVATYQNLTHNNLDKLANIYHQDVTFIDPIHQIQGVDNLRHYFEHMYENLLSSEFVLTNQIIQAEQAAIYWQMHLCHKKINGGNTITVVGHSQLRRQDGKVIFHQDYFDLGNMIYEHIPVLGKIIKLIKRKAADV